MRMLIWGAGAIGGTLGAYLARAGHDITLVDVVRDHIDAINASGLRITGPIAEFTARLPAFTPETLRGSWDIIVLATKAQHTEAATRALLPHLTENGCVVSAQNGLNELAIAAIAGESRTVGAFVNFGADYIEPGMVHYGGRGTVRIGEVFGSTAISPRVSALCDALKAFDERAQATSNLWGYLWGKEAYGAMLFANALTGDGIADGLARPEHRAVYVAIAREVLAVAAARGVRCESFDGFDPNAISLDALVAHNRKSAKTHSGIWRDLAVRKRSTEVDAQLGIIVELGREVGVAAPLTARIVELIHEIERGERAMSLDNFAALEALTA